MEITELMSPTYDATYPLRKRVQSATSPADLGAPEDGWSYSRKVVTQSVAVQSNLEAQTHLFRLSNFSIAKTIRPTLQSEVRLEVLEVEETSVRCEAMMQTGVVEVAFSPHMFPTSPRVGDAFSISVESIGGVRRPRIVQAPPAFEALAKEKAEIAALVDSF